MQLTSALINGFSESFLKPRYDNPKQTPLFHLELWDLFLSDDKYVAAASPRGHAKSTAITHAYLIFLMVFRVKCYGIIVSDTEDQAVQFLGDIKREFLENEELRSIFEIEKIVKDTANDLIVEFHDGEQFRITAYGSTQKLRGRKWRNKRPDIIIGDDMENDELVMNEERRLKARRWFQNSLFPMGGDDCWIRIVGTILHLDSQLARIVPMQDDPEVNISPLRITLRDGTTKAGWKSVLFKAHPDVNDFSEILWPEKYPKERLLQEYTMYSEDGNPEGYAQEYLNNPIDTTKSFYRARDFLPIPKSAENDYEDYYITADLAISEKQKAAFSCIGVLGFSREGQLRLREVIRFRGDTLRIIDELVTTYEKWNRKGGGVQLVGIEEENISKAIGPILRERCEKDNISLPEKLVALKPNRDKIQRSRPSQYLMRTGRCEFDKEAEWFPAFQKELIYFDRAPFKDQLDMFAWMGFLIREMAEVPTQEDQDRESYRNEIHQSYNLFDETDDNEDEEDTGPWVDFSDLADTGQSSWTGY